MYRWDVDSKLNLHDIYLRKIVSISKHSFYLMHSEIRTDEIELHVVDNLQKLN